MKELQRLYRVLLEPINTSAVVILGFYTVVWGAWVVSPFWSVFQGTQMFSALGLVAPEVFWGCFALLCGTMTLWGAFKESIRSLKWGSFIAFAHWMMIAIFYFIGDWQNTGGATCLFISIYSAYIYLNVKINSKKLPKHSRRVR